MDNPFRILVRKWVKKTLIKKILYMYTKNILVYYSTGKMSIINILNVVTCMFLSAKNIVFVDFMGCCKINLGTVSSHNAF